MKLSKCVDCLLYGKHYRPASDAERRKHNREHHGITQGKSNVGNPHNIKPKSSNTFLFKR